MKSLRHHTHKEGFTLIEVLLVIGILAIVAGIIVVAVNPAGKIGAAHNEQRHSDVVTILNGLSQYMLDNGGIVPQEIPIATQCEGGEQLICKVGADCTGLVDLHFLTDNQAYLDTIPLDPTESDINHTGYAIIQTNAGDITVCAPGAYNVETVSVTR